MVEDNIVTQTSNIANLSGDQSAITRVRFEKSKNLIKPWRIAPF